MRRLTRRVGAVLRRRLADEGDDLGALDRAQVVDDALGERLLRPGRREVAPLEVGDDDPAALVDLRLVERAREQLQLREGDVLVDVLEDPVDVGAGLDQVGRHPQGLRGRVRVLEAPRVGDEGDVERLGDLGRELDAELAGRGRRGSRPSRTRPRRSG